MRQICSVSRFASPLRASAAALCLGALAGCASTPPPSPETTLVERAAQYLAARQAGDVDTAYSLLAPSLRAVTSKEQFVKLYGEKNHMQDGYLHSVTCEGEHCALRRRFAHQFQTLRKQANFSQYINEIWVVEAGQWWRLER